MGREVRRVPKDWQHPAEEKYKPLHGIEMPDPNHRDCSHYQMYETTTEGTPISPVMKTPEELAQWLVDNKASALGRQTASYEAWLQVCKGNSVVTGVFTPNGFVSGVEYQARKPNRSQQKAYNPVQ